MMGKEVYPILRWTDFWTPQAKCAYSLILYIKLQIWELAKIKSDELDMDKTTDTSHHAVYILLRMLFGLKNLCALSNLKGTLHLQHSIGSWH